MVLGLEPKAFAMNYSPQPFCYFDTGSHSCSGWAWTCNPPASASQTARITGLCQQRVYVQYQELQCSRKNMLRFQIWPMLFFGGGGGCPGWLQLLSLSDSWSFWVAGTTGVHHHDQPNYIILSVFHFILIFHINKLPKMTVTKDSLKEWSVIQSFPIHLHVTLSQI